ncbi:hypothetical protein EYF80_052172 [Liparis tanakae]|uniref:Uncharacterized protein n=1 Tax=Liparis tanakae TaxID=230148 RepID=A0A4Z2F9U2_9TELE|nr:hypothetical protein EYF80_052172 [Liparis tanakae]
MPRTIQVFEFEVGVVRMGVVQPDVIIENSIRWRARRGRSSTAATGLEKPDGASCSRDEEMDTKTAAIRRMWECLIGHILQQHKRDNGIVHSGFAAAACCRGKGPNESGESDVKVWTRELHNQLKMCGQAASSVGSSSSGSNSAPVGLDEGGNVLNMFTANWKRRERTTPRKFRVHSETDSATRWSAPVRRDAVGFQGDYKRNTAHLFRP